MPNNTIALSLDVRNSDYPVLEGYATATAANGKVYSYKYSNPDVQVHKGQPTDINVTVGNDARYTISGVTITNDPKGDVSSSYSGRTATLSDSATDEESGIYYSITVNDSVANTTVVCDPRIDNVPQ